MTQHLCACGEPIDPRYIGTGASARQYAIDISQMRRGTNS